MTGNDWHVIPFLTNLGIIVIQILNYNFCFKLLNFGTWQNVLRYIDLAIMTLFFNEGKQWSCDYKNTFCMGSWHIEKKINGEYAINKN